MPKLQHAWTCVQHPLDVRQGQSMAQQVELVDYIWQDGQPNVFGRQVALKTAWNIPLMESLAMSVSDREVVMFMKFGWPLNHDGSPTSVTLGNHPSANRHREHISNYIAKEVSMGCLLGPFITRSWIQGVAISPMSTRRPRRDPQTEGSSWISVGHLRVDRSIVGLMNTHI